LDGWFDVIKVLEKSIERFYKEKIDAGELREVHSLSQGGKL